MTNPNTGVPVSPDMPEVLDGVGNLEFELDNFEERLAAAEPDELAQLTRRTVAQLDRCTEYSQRMWQHLALVATYLRNGVAYTAVGDDAAGPLADVDRRREWADLYSATLSLLAGPHGDSGFGSEQARLELQNVQR